MICVIVLVNVLISFIFKYVLSKGFTFCPVSESLVSNDFFSYPSDVFSERAKSFASIYNLNTTEFECFAFDGLGKKNMTKHFCFDPVYNTEICPINGYFINETLYHTKSKRNFSSFCKITEVVKKDLSKLKFIVLGGSVTLGTINFGCDKINECKSVTRYCSKCAWPNYFRMMVERIFSKDVKVVNLAQGGYCSELMAENLMRLLLSQNITKLTGNDVIFIDHSTNDNTFSTPVRSKEMSSGLETLIRKIYTFSDPRSLPTIILLATEHVPRHLIKHPSLYYTHVYSVVADHYRIPLWNMDDLYRSSHLLNGNFSYTKYITRQFNADGSHPSWMVHLFDADLIGAIMMQEFDECDKMSVDRRSSLIKTHYNNDIAQLPSPLYNRSDTEQCGGDNIIINMSYETLVTNKVENLNGSWESKPFNAWQLRLDTHGHSGGFIREYSRNKSMDQLSGSMDGAELIFTLPVSKKELSRSKKSLLVKLTVLRSYENAGFVNILFCGTIVKMRAAQGVDALWADFESYRYSLPETHSSLLKFCPDDGGFVTLTLNHTHRTDYATIRKNQKFKLMSIEVCWSNETG